MGHDLDTLSNTLDMAVERLVTHPGRLDERLSSAAELLRQLDIINLTAVPGEYQPTLLPIIDNYGKGDVGEARESERLAGSLLQIRDEVRKKVGK